MRAKHLQVVCKVATNSGLTITELNQLLTKQSVDTTSRLVRECCDESWRKDPNDRTGELRMTGYGLLRVDTDHKDHRIKRVFLSDLGISFTKRFNERVKERL